MKTLLLLRHAKSSWDDQSLKDFERPLAGRGKRDAPFMGVVLKERGPAPDLVISSPATRARETAKSFLSAAGFDAELQFNESIYDASVAELMQLVRRLPDERARVLLVGHNPGFEGLVARLTGRDERMQTAALACMEFPVARWEEVEDGQGRLVWLLRPKELRGKKD